MFTGLIECIGTVISVSHIGNNIVLGIEPGIEHFSVPLGGSVAIDGACLTAERFSGSVLYFSAVEETVTRTTLKTTLPGQKVNMERALKIGDRLDGHFVAGHVDGIGTITGDSERGGSLFRTISLSRELDEYMAEKGSVAIDGVSLTIARAGDCEISISFIPLTLKHTGLSHKKVGDQVNIECDILARYIKRIFNSGCSHDRSEHSGESLLNKMMGAGF
ncbi:MAG TPA: riboflavin synthase [Chitinispirillaceae bacterium]|nr:riboflavin synthase [Chitinispirillaceae bacterium]